MQNIILISLIVFISTHLMLLYFVKESSFYAWYLTISGSVCCFFFPYLILYVPYGFVYSYVIQWFVGYILQGVSWNIYFNILRRNK